VQKRKIPILICSLLLVSGLVISITALAQAGMCFINVTSNQQTIDGFGFSTAWCPAFSSGQTNVLFGTGSGQLGFSLLRIRIDPGGQANWGTEQGHASAAHAMGVKVLGTPWTPPASMKNNNSTICGDLLSSHYGDFANYLKQAAGFIGLDYVSFQNEPDFCPNPGYDSSNPTSTEVANWLASNAPTVGKPIVAPETVNFSDTYTNAIVNNTAAKNNTTFIAGHFYGGGNSVHQNALNAGKHVWETEHFINGTDLGTAMTVAKEVSDAMNNQFSAYFWWWIMPNHAESFIEGTTVDNRGYVLGQFAHWVRPGKIRCSTTYNPQANVFVTAYHNNGLVIVVLNTGSSTVTQNFTIQNASGITTLTPFQTGGPSNRHMTQLSAVTVTNNQFSFSLPPQTVTTFSQF
jgi:glucuronoarabinoxylan endo-1,4-beta-xylanase